jgi:hypothetical protein
MRKILWKLRYTYHVRRLLGLPWRWAWDNAGSAIENIGEDYMIWSPKDCAEDERDEWAENC